MGKKIKLLSIISLLFSIFTVYASIESKTSSDINPEYEMLDSNLFAETVAKIEPFTVKNEETGELNNGYNIIYNVTESTAYNKDNKKIEGEIVQHIFFNDNSQKATPQEVYIKYKKNEPIVFHFKKLLECEK